VEAVEKDGGERKGELWSICAAKSEQVKARMLFCRSYREGQQLGIRYVATGLEFDARGVVHEEKTGLFGQLTLGIIERTAAVAMAMARAMADERDCG